jgi:hypothetical protein
MTTTALIITFLAGLVLGRHWKVFVLVPATIIVALVAVGIAASLAQAPGPTCAWVLASMAVLQIGYLAGAGIHASRVARQRQRRRTVAAPSSLRRAFH